ncbi:uncharacterized protein LOC113291193 [Papaver somniferum]|uniref:uncharacterized protein LOC113291193 n=1 Tax=Papaver somniferum TaxID=3469 RepID=UPI000E701828|nr:uncharacterized protein LOC113291193 [Papaver somniferum]
MCLMSWIKVCKPKKMGGLGVKNLRCTSRALKGKWLWRYTKENKMLWRKVVQQKPKNQEEVLIPVDDGKPQGRGMWKTILKSTNFLNEHLVFQLKNGRGIKFWVDKWTTNGPLKDRYPTVFKACSEKNLPALVDEEDIVSFLDDYTVKKRYELQIEEDTTCNFDKFLWKKEIPYKHRGTDIPNTVCSLCNKEDETTDHIFIRCDLAKEVWEYFVKACNVNWIVPATVMNLFMYWKGIVLKGRSKEVWEKLIYAIL